MRLSDVIELDVLEAGLCQLQHHDMRTKVLLQRRITEERRSGEKGKDGERIGTGKEES